MKRLTLYKRLFLFLLLETSLFSCKGKVDSTPEKEEIINTGMFQVQLRSWSFLGKEKFLVLYNNLPNTRFKRETLIIVREYQHGGLSPDTLKVRINKNQEDSIYYYAYKYLTNFKLGEGKDTISVYNDGLNFSLSFETHEHKKLEATKYRTSGFHESSDEAGKLVAFINRIVPETFRVY